MSEKMDQGRDLKSVLVFFSPRLFNYCLILLGRTAHGRVQCLAAISLTTYIISLHVLYNVWCKLEDVLKYHGLHAFLIQGYG